MNEYDVKNDDPHSDSDGDGYHDLEETEDMNRTGRPDMVHPLDSTKYPPLDNDKDFSCNWHDQDDDNDEKLDSEEGTFDKDGDGIIDAFESDKIDDDDDGVMNEYDVKNDDPHSDSDGDGYHDLEETEDMNRTGRPDMVHPLDSTKYPPLDNDKDFSCNWHDQDDDNDEKLDSEEGTFDKDGDGIIDAFESDKIDDDDDGVMNEYDVKNDDPHSDSDGDGYHDLEETEDMNRTGRPDMVHPLDSTKYPPLDNDKDFSCNWHDQDDDNDEKLDSEEGTFDKDGDGIIDAFESDKIDDDDDGVMNEYDVKNDDPHSDSDGDGYHDLEETEDMNRTGRPDMVHPLDSTKYPPLDNDKDFSCNWHDQDDDNDEKLDSEEGTFDKDGDGIIDAFESDKIDDDDDGVMNEYDVKNDDPHSDSDGDGYHDLEETEDMNRTGRPDMVHPLDSTKYPPLDNDKDFSCNWHDQDDDNDEKLDSEEGTFDKDGDGIIDAFESDKIDDDDDGVMNEYDVKNDDPHSDSDGDGYHDLEETEDMNRTGRPDMVHPLDSTKYPPLDNDKDFSCNWHDQDDDNDEKLDSEEGTFDKDGDGIIDAFESDKIDDDDDGVMNEYDVKNDDPHSDSDGDGYHDLEETEDMNRTGRPDMVHPLDSTKYPPLDNDKDFSCNWHDQDDDNDEKLDSEEGTFDKDGDGIIDAFESDKIDDDDDGVMNEYDVKNDDPHSDSDGDGYHDLEETEDMNRTGRPDMVHPLDSTKYPPLDNDKDFSCNWHDQDDDNDEKLDSEEGTFDKDGDGIIDAFESDKIDDDDDGVMNEYDVKNDDPHSDSDGDGYHDLEETEDMNRTGRPDMVHPLDSTKYPPLDNDKDFSCNWHDQDDDNDEKLDSEEGTFDKDGDGIIDAFESDKIDDDDDGVMNEYDVKNDDPHSDSDGDGYHDLEETEDMNRTGRPDMVHPLDSTKYPPLDNDKDFSCNWHDQDDDNDEKLDSEEGTFDKDGDGIIDAFESDKIDDDDDGVMNEYDVKNDDPHSDSDGDGYHDLEETEDMNRTGRPDMVHPLDSTKYPPLDNDKDFSCNWHDQDDDNDEKLDSEEGTFDKDGDGIIDAFESDKIDDDDDGVMNEYDVKNDDPHSDSDGDGYHDLEETEDMNRTGRPDMVHPLDSTKYPPLDNDKDFSCNWHDQDDDNDEKLDSEEGTFDKDGDGIIDAFESDKIDDDDDGVMNEYDVKNDDPHSDSDGDGYHDLEETEDMNRTGRPDMVHPLDSTKYPPLDNDKDFSCNWHDQDDDNDEKLDSEEGTFDKDGDGIIDAFESDKIDDDDDGVMNEYDVKNDDPHSDSDGDGYHDLEETEDMNRTGRPDMVHPLDSTKYPPLDNDKDFSCNWHDQDDDNDEKLDSEEGTFDKDGDGIIDAFESDKIDDDDDGVMNEYDVK